MTESLAHWAEFSLMSFALGSPGTGEPGGLPSIG